MQLNTDLVRDIMIYLEDNLTLKNNIFSNQIHFEGYNDDDIIYTINKLHEAGYIKCRKASPYTIKIILEITWDGHIFLDDIRDGNIWIETKHKISKFKSVSIPIIQSVAISVIKDKLNI